MPQETCNRSAPPSLLACAPSDDQEVSFVKPSSSQKKRGECAGKASRDFATISSLSLSHLGLEHQKLIAGYAMQVSQMARAMVVNYGFSDIGPWSLQDPSAGSQDMIMRMMARNSMSENLQRKIDVAVRDIAAEAYETALKHIR